ncbi:hypothetical protein GMMP13_990035 [Candidatus Magnetomoraceae bacterium gMMP-13]
MLPAPDTLTTTVGTTNVNAYTPVLIWDALDSAIGYTITVTGPSYSDTQWYTTNGANCNSYTCYVNQNILSGGGQAGTYTWTVTGRSGLGEGSSESSTFILSILPAPEYLTITVGTTGGTANPDTYTPVLQWSAVSYTDTAGNQSYTVITSGYDIEIYGPNGYAASYVTDANGYTHSTESLPITVCSGGSCSVTLSVLGTGGGAGQYTWQVRAESGIGDGEWTNFIPDDDHRFTLSVLSAPAPLSAVRVGYAYGEALFYTPNFQWGSIDNATGYTVVVEYPDASANSNWYTPGGANCSTTQSGQTCSVTVSVMEGGFGTYKWNVRGVDALGAGDWSGYSPPFIFTSLVAPTSLAETENDYTPTLSWRIAGTFTGEVNGYTVQVYGPDGTAVHSSAYTVDGYCESTAVGSLCTVTPSVLSGGPGTYTWSARAYNEVGAGAWATADDFVLTQLTGPTLQTPTFEGEGNSYTPTFHWTPSSSTTTSYTIQVIAPTGSSWAGYAVSVSAITAGCSGGTGTCSYTSSILLGGAGNYSWKVKAIDELGVGDWSTGTLTIDSIVAPSSLALTLDVTSDAVLYTPTFNWTGTSVATQYSLLVYYPSDSSPSGSLTYNGLPYTVFAFTPSEANCVGGGTCSVSPSIMHGGDGTYTWYVRASDLAGVQSSYISGGTFTLNVYGSSPSQSYTLATSSTDAYTPTLNWTALSLATNYTVALYYPPLTAYDTYSYTPGQTSCDSGELTCSVILPSILNRGAGTYNWYIQARSGLGESSWYGPDAFTLSLLSAPTSYYYTAGTTDADAYTPTLAWSALSYATAYSVYVTKPSGITYVRYTAEEAHCVTGGTCYVTPTVYDGGEGTYTWYVAGISALGDGTWSSAQTFSLNLLSAPTSYYYTAGTGSDAYTPTLAWSALSYATEYSVYVTKPSGITYVRYTAEEAHCVTGGTCYVTPTVYDGGEGTYTWYVAGISALGDGSWSSAQTFSLGALSAPADLTYTLGTSDSTTYTINFRWTRVSNASGYTMVVTNPAGSIAQWYDVDSQCAQSTCSVTQTIGLTGGAGDYGWWVRARDALGEGDWSANGNTFTLPVLSAPTLLSPSTTLVDDYTPTYQWTGLTGATWYNILVYDSSNQSVISNWFEVTDVSCIGGGTCTILPTTEDYLGATPASTRLSTGIYRWWVQGYNALGTGEWSDLNGMSFTVTVAAPTQYTPSGNMNTEFKPTYVWSKVASAESYRLIVQNSSGTNLIDEVYQASECGASNCSFTPTTYVEGGNHNWYVGAYNASGYGWTSATSFSLITSVPGEPVQTSPSGATVARPTWLWEHNGATYYELLLYNPSTGATYHQQWYESTNICTETECSVTSESIWSGVDWGTGTYSWYVRGYNPNGIGVWADLESPMTFTTP